MDKNDLLTARWENFFLKNKFLELNSKVRQQVSGTQLSEINWPLRILVFYGQCGNTFLEGKFLKT